VITTLIIARKNNSVTPDAAYNIFLNSLNNSPDDEYKYDPSNSETQEHFYIIAGEFLSPNEESEYYDSLENNYRSLRDQLKSSKQKTLQNLGEQLEDIFPIHFAMVRQSDINDELLYDIAYGKDEDAREIISKISNLAKNNHVDRAEKTARNFAEYLEKLYDLYNIFQAQGCIQSDGLSLDPNCVNNLSIDRVAELRQQTKESLRLAEINAELLNQDFYRLLNNIGRETENSNE